jgi:hypothetical protein
MDSNILGLLGAIIVAIGTGLATLAYNIHENTYRFLMYYSVRNRMDYSIQQDVYSRYGLACGPGW